MGCCDTEIETGCMICGKDLVYMEKPVLKRCEICGREELTHAHCTDGHYVCDDCHSKTGVEVIKEYCLSTDLKDPMEIAENIMKDPRIPMHGPEHHALVPAVLVTAYKNLSGKVDDEDIVEALERGRQIPGGACGYYGACGAGIGVGAAISVIFKATPMTPLKRSKAHLAVAKALEEIGKAGGARCCKRCTRLSIEVAKEFFRDEFNIVFSDEYDIGSCEYTKVNRECLYKCKYRIKKPLPV